MLWLGRVCGQKPLVAAVGRLQYRWSYSGVWTGGPSGLQWQAVGHGGRQGRQQAVGVLRGGVGWALGLMGRLGK